MGLLELYIWFEDYYIWVTLDPKTGWYVDSAHNYEKEKNDARKLALKAF